VVNSDNFNYRGVTVICSGDIKRDAVIHADFGRISGAHKKRTRKIPHKILLAVLLHSMCKANKTLKNVINHRVVSNNENRLT
jgi:hypothetical protein